MCIRRSVILAALVLALCLAAPSSPHAQGTSVRGFAVRTSALSTTQVNVSGYGVSIDSIVCWNPSNAVAYLQLFNVASAVTVGTTAPTWSVGIPTVSALTLTNMNLWFGLGVRVAATTTATGSSAISSALDCNFILK